MKKYNKIYILIIIILLYQVLGATIPYLIKTPISDSSQKAFDGINYYSEELQGADSVYLVESFEDALGTKAELIRNATKSIDIAYYTFEEGEISSFLLNELILAADRGVEIRILLNGKSTKTRFGGLELLKVINSYDNVVYKVYNRVNFFKPWTIQSTLHDKFIIVDDEWLILGGRNIGDRFFDPDGFEDKLTYDREVLLKGKHEEGSAIEQINEYMELIWNSKNSKTIKSQKKPDAKFIDKTKQNINIFIENNEKFFECSLKDYEERLVAANKVTLIHNPINTSNKEPWVGYQLNSLIKNADNKIMIQTPYMTGNKEFLDALRNTKEFVEEKTIVTNSILSSPNYLAFPNYILNRKNFLKTNTRLYEFQSNDSIHAKSLLIDDNISVVGSFNMDNRSLYMSTETMLVIHSQEFNNILENAFNDIIYSSLEVDSNTNKYILNDDTVYIMPSYIKILAMKIMSLFSIVFKFLL